MISPAALQIRHPQHIHLAQLERINRVRDIIHDSLIGGQIIPDRRETAHGTRALDHQVAVTLHGFAQDIRRELGRLVLAREPVVHFVAHEDAELHFELAFGFDEAARSGHNGRREDAFEVERTHDGL